MDGITQKILEVALTLFLGGVIQAWRTYFRNSIQNSLEEQAVRRDIDHLKNTQSQHGHVLGALDAKVDRLVVFVNRQEMSIRAIHSSAETAKIRERTNN
jgi:hypothetical protein